MLSLFSRFLLAVSIIRIVVAVPLGIEYDKTTGLTPGEVANKGRLDTAAALAHTQVGKMREGLDKVKNGDAKAIALYHAAFGTKADINVVDSTVTALQHGNIQAKLATHDFTEGGKYPAQADVIAAVPWSKDGKKPWTPGPARFSDQFHGAGAKPLDDAGRAGTLIHEATHQLVKTGDDINKSGKIIKPYDGTSKPTGATGYTSDHNMHKTAAQVNADKTFTDVRDSAPNMHENAESYAVFASLCSQPGALRRRDVRLYNRALLARDHDQLHYLARRNSCQLPPDYFAKRIAAKKAAAAKAAHAAEKPAPNSKVAATSGVKPSTKDAKATAQHALKAPHGAEAATKGARLTKVPTSKGLNGAKAAKASLRGNRLATNGGARSAIKGVKASTAARGAKGSTKGATAGHLAKTTTAKGLRTPLKTNKQAAKGRSRTSTPGSKASKSSKQRAHALKLPKVNSHANAASRKGSLKTTAVRGSKAVQSKNQRKLAGTHPAKAPHTVKSPHAQSAPRKNSAKVGAAHAVRPVGRTAKPLAAKVATAAKGRKH